MEIMLVMLAFIAGGTAVLLLIDGVSDVAARALVGGARRLRRLVRPARARGADGAAEHA
ncbi:hypothetical protein LG314_12150 [Agrococcus terreus]|uniref:hypothetical protein n=1 Tax=Agrococcus terreus TaxID=574649 RepID=UPI00385066F9